MIIFFFFLRRGVKGMGLFQGILWDRELDCSFVRSTLWGSNLLDSFLFMWRMLDSFRAHFDSFRFMRRGSIHIDCLALRYLGFYLSQERERTMSASKQEALVLLEQFFFFFFFFLKFFRIA